MTKRTPKPFTEFSLAVRFADLMPGWQAIKPTVSRTDWYVLNLFAGYCSRRGIDAGQAAEQHLQEYGLARKTAGYVAVDEKIERIRSIVHHASRSQPKIAFPSLAAPRSRETPRQDQYDNAPPQLRADIDALTGACMPNAKPESSRSRRNFLLRMIALAESRLGNGAIASLDTLFAKPALRAMRDGNWGDPGGDLKDPTSLGVTNREYLLSNGRRFYALVRKDQPRAAYFDRLLKNAVRRSNAIPDRKVKETVNIDSAMLRSIGDKAKDVIAEFIRSDSEAIRDLERAQTALGIVLLLATALRTGKIAIAGFFGPMRKIPSKMAIERPTLALNADPTTSLEEDMAEATKELIDGYWVEYERRTGYAPTFILCHRDGAPKSSVTFAVGVRTFGDRHGFSITAEMIRLAIVRELYAAKTSRGDIAGILGVRQLVNLDSRYSIFEGEDASQDLSDHLDEADADAFDEILDPMPLEGDK